MRLPKSSAGSERRRAVALTAGCLLSFAPDTARQVQKPHNGWLPAAIIHHFQQVA